MIQIHVDAGVLYRYNMMLDMLYIKGLCYECAGGGGGPGPDLLTFVDEKPFFH